MVNGAFDSNSATNGGAIYATKGFASFQNPDLWLTRESSFTSNSASGNGGALYLVNWGTNSKLATSTLHDNTSPNPGSAVYLDDSNSSTFFQIAGNDFCNNDGGCTVNSLGGTDIAGTWAQGFTLNTCCLA